MSGPNWGFEMKYSEARPQIKSGDVVAFAYKGMVNFGDFLIWFGRLFQITAWTHVGVVWCVGERVLIIDAVGSGVRDYPLGNTLPFYHLPRPNGLSAEQLAFALSKKGQKYSYWECILAWFRRNNPKNKSWQCAEFVCAVLNLDCQATPSAVVDFLMAEGSVCTLITGEKT